MPKTKFTYPNDSEQTRWLALSKKGDQLAFRHIVEKYQRPVYNLCYYMLQDAPEAEDATQEVFIRAYFKLDSYDETRKFSTWLFSIASHYCLDKLKLRRIRLVSWADLAEEHRYAAEGRYQPEKALVKAETTEEVSALLMTLHPDYRTPLILKYWLDMSYEEMAQTLDITVSAIKSRLFRGRKMMAQAFLQQQSAISPPGQMIPAGNY